MQLESVLASEGSNSYLSSGKSSFINYLKRATYALLSWLVAMVGMSTFGSAQAALPVVAIHDSEFTRAFDGMTAANPGTPSGTGTTGYEWWPTNWHYFV